MRRLFGTDGIRGKANTYPITPEIALQVGKAAAHAFGAKGHGSARAVIGKDTRLSGYMIEAAITSGLVSMGMDVFSVGPMPTPAVAHLTKSIGANLGVMITASHNPSDDNGIKLFNADGYKLPDEIELDIEQHILKGEINSEHISTELIGKAYRIDDARGRYIEFAKSSIRNHSLKGLKIVLDCANGAGYWIAPIILRELGAEVVVIGAKPDGYNINMNCGATCPETLAGLVRENGADAGIALDGDADRVIFCDENGDIVNGDRIIAICAIDYKNKGLLKKNTVAVTTMTNMGFHSAMEKHGIEVETTDVGDRYIIERMREKGLNIGGEQSGHIVFMDYATTGDGIITALHVLRLLAEKNCPLSEIASCMEEYPQRITSLDVEEKVPVEKVPELDKAMKECADCLDGRGRVILRYSGTENKIRILVEAQEEEEMLSWTEKLSKIIQSEL